MAKKFFWGLVTGGIAGAAYGLLTTPRSGKENQLFIKEYIQDTTDHVQDVSAKLTDLQGAVQTLAEEGRYFTTVFSKEMDQTISNFTYEAEPRLQRIQENADKLLKDAEAAGENLATTFSNGN